MCWTAARLLFGMRLDCYWIATEMLLGCCLNSSGLLLDCYWIATETLLNGSG